MRKYVSNLPTKEIKFMGDKITIRKISAGAVKRIGKASASLQKDSDDADTLKVLLAILQEGVVLAEDDGEIDEALLEEFPLDELNKLSTAIMEFGGVPVGKEGNAG
jgi:hypothetical protein